MSFWKLRLGTSQKHRDLALSSLAQPTLQLLPHFAIPLGIYASKKSFAGCYFASFLTRSFIFQARMSCCWFHSFISIVSQVFGWSNLVADYALQSPQPNPALTSYSSY
jgi:hypothetical protein